MSNKIFLYLFNSLIETENNYLNFNNFFNYSKINGQKFSQDDYKNLNDMENSLYFYITDEYIIEKTFKKFLEKLQTSSSHIYIYLIKIIIRKNYNKQDKNYQSYAHSNIFKHINIIVNILFTFSLAEFANLYWYISFINMIKKNIL